MLKKRLFIFILCVIFISTSIFSLAGCTSKEIDTSDTKNEENKDEDKNEDKNEDKDTVNFTTEPTRKVIDVPYNQREFEAKVKTYKINEDLSNVVNLNQFGEFTKEQKELLAKNGFFVNPTKEEQLFYIYEKNEYKKLPSFVTVDSVLQVYHIFYDYSLRTLESEKLISVLEELTENMIDKSVYIYNKLENKNLKDIQLKNIAFFCVPWLALEKDIPEWVPDKARDLAIKEYSLVKAQDGFNKSYIFPYELNYSEYMPRGHYTRSEDLKRYFKAMMWYGQGPFPLYDNQGNRTVKQTLQALLITYTMFLNKDGSNDIELWEKIYSPTYFYVGITDDLNLYQYKDLLVKVYGEEPDINKLDDQEKIDMVYEEAKKLPEPLIKPKYTKVSTPAGKQFRFMGQRYIPDSEIIQEMVYPILRPIPSGLDVMAVLGSKRAYDIQVNINKENEKWDGYIGAFNKMKNKFDNISEEKWRSNMYYGWLWTLKGLIREYDEGYPLFMRNGAWIDKSLNTALGSWAELRHDTILYGKKSGAECGGGVEPPEVKGYVEPNIEVYEKLLWLTKYSRVNLKERGILTGSIESKMQTFEDLLEFLINCSIKELRNEELTEDEYYQLLTYGGLLEHLTASFAGDGMRWFEITSETDKNMAVIADIHTIAPNDYSQGGYFEVGVGPAYEIYVIVPIGDKLYLTRGAVFSYYEFDSIKMLTDEDWQKMIKEDNTSPQPDWMKSFIRRGKEEIPTPAEPYSTGC